MSCRFRRLSDPEWAAFQGDVNVSALGLPPWGGLVRWGAMDVLVFVGVTGEVFATDITGCPLVDTVRRYGTYNPSAGSWWAQLPAELWSTTENDVAYAYQTAPGYVRDTLIATMDAIGKAVAAALNPTLGSLAPLLVVALVVLGVMYLPKPKRAAA